MGQQSQHCKRPTKKLKKKGTMSNKNFSYSKSEDSSNFICGKCRNPQSHKKHHDLCEHSMVYKRKKKEDETKKLKSNGLS